MLRRLWDWLELKVAWAVVWFLACHRLDLEAVCVMAKQGHDFHDYHDTEHGQPDHFVPLTCKRCGRDFWL